MKIRPVGTELFYADGRTDRQANRRADRYYELLVTCRNFANDPINNRGSSPGKEGKLGKEGLTVVTRTPVPENLSSLAPCCVHLHIQLRPTVCVDCLISEHGVNVLNRNVAKQLRNSTQECEGVNCVSYEA